MNIPKEAIEKANEGGWLPVSGVEFDLYEFTDSFAFLVKDDEDGQGVTLRHSEITLDPKFWQALGKSLGWTLKHEYGCYALQEGGKCDCLGVLEEFWHYHAMEFCDLIYTDQPTDDFWQELLK